MGMEGGLFGRIGRKTKETLKAGALAAGMFAASGSAEASQKAIVTAQVAAELAEYKLKHPQASAAEIEVQKTKGDVKIAIAEDLDEKEAKLASTKGIGVAPKNSAETTVTHRIVDILDENGRVIGQAEEGSKDWKKLEAEKIKVSRPFETGGYLYPSYSPNTSPQRQARIDAANARHHRDQRDDKKE